MQVWSWLRKEVYRAGWAMKKKIGGIYHGVYQID